MPPKSLNAWLAKPATRRGAAPPDYADPESEKNEIVAKRRKTTTSTATLTKSNAPKKSAPTKNTTKGRSPNLLSEVDIERG